MHISSKNECIWNLDETRYMSFLVRDHKLSEEYNEIWEKVKNSIKSQFDSEPVCNKKYLRAKIKSYYRKINTSFHINKIPKEGSQFFCLSVMLINSVFRTGWYDIQISDKENSNEENSDEENSDWRDSNQENLKNTNITHILKFISETYKKYFFIIFSFLYLY